MVEEEGVGLRLESEGIVVDFDGDDGSGIDQWGVAPTGGRLDGVDNM